MPLSPLQSQAVKVTALGAVGVSVMMAIALSLAFTLGAPVPKSTVMYTSIDGTALEVTSSNKDCSSIELGACPTVLMYDTANQTVEFTTTVAGNDTSVKSVSVQVCYGAPYIAGRPWRKKTDVIGTDKQCGIKACTAVPVENGEAKCTWTVGDMLGTAVYYFRALGSDETGTFVTGATNMNENFQIDAYNGRTMPIIIAAAVMSGIAWAILIGGLIMERVKKID